jgi:hypothetical protein
MTNEQIIPHPYTYLPARAIKENDIVKWFDLESGEELPPFYGYGKGSQEKVDDWYRMNMKGLDK